MFVAAAVLAGFAAVLALGATVVAAMSFRHRPEILRPVPFAPGVSAHHGGVVVLRSAAVRATRSLDDWTHVMTYELEDHTGAVAWESPPGLNLHNGDECELTIADGGRPTGFRNLTTVTEWILPTSLPRRAPKWVLAVLGAVWIALVMTAGMLISPEFTSSAVSVAVEQLTRLGNELRLGDLLPRVGQVPPSVTRSAPVALAFGAFVGTIVAGAGLVDPSWRAPGVWYRVGLTGDWTRWSGATLGRTNS